MPEAFERKLDAGGVFCPDAGFAMTKAIVHLPYLSHAKSLASDDSSATAVNCCVMEMRVEKISAMTFRVADMALSVRFYRDVLVMELLFGGEGAGLCSLRVKDVQSDILNLELGRAVTRWGRLIFYVADVDAFWAYLCAKGFRPKRPRDASWGERYFHTPDPDGHELSFCAATK